MPDSMETSIPIEICGMWSDPFGFSHVVFLVSDHEVLHHQIVSQKLRVFPLTSVLRLTTDAN
jgi:hypothetical protein